MVLVWWVMQKSDIDERMIAIALTVVEISHMVRRISSHPCHS